MTDPPLDNVTCILKLRSFRIVQGLAPVSSWLTLAVILFPGMYGGTAYSDDDSAALQSVMAFQKVVVDVVEQVEPSVVSIARLSPDPVDAIPTPIGQRIVRPGPGQAGYIPTDFGSGVIIARGEQPTVRYILTAGHVVFGRRWLDGDGIPSGADLETLPIVVSLSSHHDLEAEVLRPQVVSADPRSDLAILRIDLAEQSLPNDFAPPIQLPKDPTIKKGQFVIALGNPYAVARDGSASVSTGIVSNISRKPWPPGGVLGDPTDESATIQHYGNLLHVDTRLDLGTSGGAIVNLQGELIGLSMSLAALQGYEKSVGFAVPIDKQTQRIIDSLLKGHEVEYGFLGIQPGNANQAMMKEFRDVTLQASAARVIRVAIGSPARLAGIDPGDILLAVEDRAIYSETDLVREVGLIGPGLDARLTFLRPSTRRIQTVKCRLGKWPVYDDSLLVTTAQRYPNWRGLSVDYVTARRRYLPSNVLAQYPQAVVVTSVVADTPAAKAGLGEATFITRVGTVRVTHPDDFYTAVGKFQGPVALTLLDGQQVTIAPESTAAHRSQ